MSVDLDLVGLHAGGGAAGDLLRYYQSRIQSFDGERDRMLERIADIEVRPRGFWRGGGSRGRRAIPHTQHAPTQHTLSFHPTPSQSQNSETHRLRWEVKARNEEVSELQKALQDAQLYLFDEREQVLKLNTEVQNLRTQEVEDRRRIQQLLAITQPLTEDYAFFRDVRPVPTPTVAATGGNNGRAGFPLPPPTSSAAAPTTYGLRDAVSGRGSGGAGGVPSSSAAGAGAAGGGGGGGAGLAALTRQLQDYKRLADERTAAYARDRQALLDASTRRCERDESTIRALEGAVEGAQAKLTALTRDFLLQRYHLTGGERVAKEAAAQAVAEKEEAQRELVRVSAQADADVGALRRALDDQAQNLRKVLSSKLTRASDAVKIIGARAESGAAESKSTIARLTAAVHAAKDKHAALEKRRALDIEGFQRDVSSLRREVRRLEAAWAGVAGYWPQSGPAPPSLPHDLLAGFDAADAALAAAARGEGGGAVQSSGRGGSAGVGMGLRGVPTGGSPPPPPSYPGKGGPKPGASYGRATLAGYDPVAFAADVLRETFEAFPTYGPDGARVDPLPGDLDYEEAEEGEGEGEEEEKEGMEPLRPSVRQGGASSPSVQSRGSGSSGGSGGRLSGGARRVPVSSPDAAPRFDARAGRAGEEVHEGEGEGSSGYPTQGRSKVERINAELAHIRGELAYLQGRA